MRQEACEQDASRALRSARERRAPGPTGAMREQHAQGETRTGAARRDESENAGRQSQQGQRKRQQHAKYVGRAPPCPCGVRGQMRRPTASHRDSEPKETKGEPKETKERETSNPKEDGAKEAEGHEAREHSKEMRLGRPRP